MPELKNYDILIVGGGIIGLCLALEIKKRRPNISLGLLEKEKYLGVHASGRNSGVLHAGFYYNPDSLKAKFCKEGNASLSDYCLEKGLPIKRCGKLVAAANEYELTALETLYNRGRSNNVSLEYLTADEARKIEPRVKTYAHAIYSPTTSSVDPQAIMQSLEKDALQAGICIHKNTAYLRCSGNIIQTSQGDIQPGYLINAAGLYADKLARDFGFAADLRILPFKGLYLYAREGSYKPALHIYPVPDLQNPFLGVHFTLSVQGRVKIGPTAVPAFWRENYAGFSSFNPLEFMQTVGLESSLLLRNDFNFRSLALKEIKKYYRPYLIKQASRLLEGVGSKDQFSKGSPGIRAQLLHTKKRTLINDFCVQGDNKSFHVLNAVSPAFTCALPFCAYLADQVEGMSAN